MNTTYYPFRLFAKVIAIFYLGSAITIDNSVCADYVLLKPKVCNIRHGTEILDKNLANIVTTVSILTYKRDCDCERFSDEEYLACQSDVFRYLDKCTYIFKSEADITFQEIFDVDNSEKFMSSLSVMKFEAKSMRALIDASSITPCTKSMLLDSIDAFLCLFDEN